MIAISQFRGFYLAEENLNCHSVTCKNFFRHFLEVLSQHGDKCSRLAIASHPQNIHKTGIGTGTEFSTLNIVNNLQYSHNLQMFMLIKHQKWIPPPFKGKLQKDQLPRSSASDFSCDLKNTDKLHKK